MIIKTNIRDFVDINDGKFITSMDDFRYEFNKGICFTFNQRESFYGYYDCINRIVEYINMEKSSDLIVLCESCHKKFHDIE